MLTRAITLVSVVLLIVLVAIVWWRSYPVEKTMLSGRTDLRKEQAQVTATALAQEDQHVAGTDSQQSLRRQSREEAIEAFVEQVRRDPRYQWKIPIKFFGKVVDQHNEPVADADVHFQWNDFSERGTSEATGRSDSHGLFSLSGVKGKFLAVRVEKSGYYTAVDGGGRIAGFEYANPGENRFYEPDSTNPVIFRLQKKGKAQSLVKKSVELTLSGQGAMETVDLPTGRVTPSGGQLQVTVWKPIITTEQINAGRVFPYDWRIHVRVDNGGLSEHKDFLALEAPESGYVSEYKAELRPTSGASADVTVDKQFYFYVGQPRKYGRFHLRTNGDRPYVFIDYWFNPSGSRSLE